MPDPISFLQNASKICNEFIIEYKYYKSKKDLAYYGVAQKKLNDFNKLYFIFSPICLKAILENLCFKIIISEKTKLFNNLRFPRHIIYAKKTF